jgi:hypothetical protein
MVFDLAAPDRTPLLRPRSALIANEPPDRIVFDAEVADVEFVFHDRPRNLDGQDFALEGVACNPDPNDVSQGSAYQVNQTDSVVRPDSLRGTFAFAALTNGSVGVIDVEDLDAPCRRPKQVNRSSEPDAADCANDAYDVAELAIGTTLTVTNEVSCQVFQPHRARVRSLVNHDTNGSAPALRGLPVLHAGDGAALASDQGELGRAHPKLLALPFDTASESLVYLGGTVLSTAQSGAEQLVIEPASAEKGSLLLPEREPRAYQETGGAFAAIFEGVLGRYRGRFEVKNAGDVGRDTGLSAERRVAVASLVNAAGLCSAGVEDASETRKKGQQLLGDSSAALSGFTEAHTDYVSLSSTFPPEADPYWTGPGAACGAGTEAERQGRSYCELVFGQELQSGRKESRDFRVLRAYNDLLLLEPRPSTEVDGSGGEVLPDELLAAAACCFPFATDFELRAGRQWMFRAGHVHHDIVTNSETLACERRACDPLLSKRRGRAFEVSCAGDQCDGVGSAKAEWDVCQVPSQGGVVPSVMKLPESCFINDLTARFAIYRGASESQRDMAFVWGVTGGADPLVIRLGAGGSSIPRQLHYVSQVNRLAVADGSSLALHFLSLRKGDGQPGFSLGSIH